jgi:hypothetical protein
VGVPVNNPSDDLLKEQAYLVERGVRAAEQLSGLDEHGFYAPGAWTREQLVGFANEIDSLVPDGRETAVDLGIVRAVKTLRDALIVARLARWAGEATPVVSFVRRSAGPSATLPTSWLLACLLGRPLASSRPSWRSS